MWDWGPHKSHVGARNSKVFFLRLGVRGPKLGFSKEYTVDLFTNDVILAFDDALRWNKCRMDIEIELTKGIFFLEVVFPSTKAHFDLNSPLIGRKKKLNFLRFLVAHQQRLGTLIPKMYTCP